MRHGVRGLRWLVVAGLTASIVAGPAAAAPATKTETFDRDPGWDGRNNRSAENGQPPRAVRQDFGFGDTAHAGGKRGEVGGLVQAAAEPAWYGKVIPEHTFDQPLHASGTLAVADGGTHLLLGFFNADTSKEWRTPNTVAIRINGRGDHFLAYVEYCTSKWRAGGDTPKSFPTKTGENGKQALVGYPSGKKVHRWELRYDPAANNGGGAVYATIDGDTAVCNLDPGHRPDGARFNRFGLLNVMKSADDATEIYLDDVTVNGQAESFDADPKWDGRGNRASFVTRNVRPWFDFGHSATRLAGGRRAGELGGLTFRGDCRYPERMAYYADRVGPLELNKPIKASGKVALHRGVSDSTTLFGFFNVASAMKSNPSQKQGLPDGIIGVNIEGPSSEGFCFYPVARLGGRDGVVSPELRKVRILPDGAVHDWTFDYDPAPSGGRGRITVSLDGKSIHVDLNEGDKSAAQSLDRFGLVTPWIDGNGQVVYFDDITYSVGQ